MIPPGVVLEQDLRSRGVDTRLIRTDGIATGTVIALVDANGERSMLPDAGANAKLSPDDLGAAVFEGIAHVHLSGYVLLDPRSRAAAMAAIETSRRQGLTTSIDPASTALIEKMGVGEFLEATRGVDYMLPALDEGRLLVACDDPVDVVGRLSSMYSEVALTLNSDGALGRASNTVVMVPAEPLPRPLVDSVGAGDAFVAGRLAERVAGGGPKACLRAGCRAGARAVCQSGAWPSIDEGDVPAGAVQQV